MSDKKFKWNDKIKAKVLTNYGELKEGQILMLHPKTFLQFQKQKIVEEIK